MNAKNFHTTKPLVKKLEVIDKIFGELGRTQGKRIELKKWETMIGYTIENQNKTRFELVIDLLKLDFSESTLRKLFNLYLFEKNGDEAVHGLQFLKRIDDKSLSIDQADQLRRRTKMARSDKRTSRMEEKERGREDLIQSKILLLKLL